MATTDILLAPGERGLYSRSFRPNLVLFWLRTQMVVTNKRIAVKYPNTVLGVIPLGFEERSMPMGSVAGVTTSFKVFLGPLLFHSFLALIFFILMFNGGVGFNSLLFLILFSLFAAFAASAIRSSMVVTNNGGGIQTNTVSFLEKGALEDFKNKANEIIYSASDGGTSWTDSYRDNSQGFQNAIGGQQQFGQQQYGPQSHIYGAQQQYGPQSHNYGAQQQFATSQNSQQSFSNPEFTRPLEGGGQHNDGQIGDVANKANEASNNQ
ncbi:hypothetical protein [Corynebacterium anserum]|uniref:hypothetical protein n=1 Tax=Corynebacterium anserum TaxID=2684406 RepID=UPI001639DCE8|nr:hypothetical protein [Corynebacterium anserum]